MVQEIVSAIKTRIQTVASDYKEIGYIKDITKNSFKDNHKRFGVLPKSISETQSVTRFLTFDQTFEIVLTQGFINAQMSDSQEQTRAIELQDLALNLYKDLVNTKAGLSNSVITVSNLSIDNPETIEQHKLTSQRFSFNIKYRTNL